jgi:predicted ester cyclase
LESPRNSAWDAWELPADRQEIAVTAMHFHRLVDGKIVEHWEQFDLMAMLQQLGALPQGKDLAV